MYAVVGCRGCDALWIVEGRPETTGCPRCGTRHQFARLRNFVETEDRDHAREARAAMLAERSGLGEAFAELDSYAEMERRLDEVGVADAEYLAAAGIDADAVDAAGDRAAQGRATGGANRRETVVTAIEELDAPTEDAVVEYAVDRGVPAEYVRTALEKLLRAGAASESGGRYRLL